MRPQQFAEEDILATVNAIFTSIGFNEASAVR